VLGSQVVTEEDRRGDTLQEKGKEEVAELL
jgi:hypothetical protein